MCDLFMERIEHLHSKVDILSLELIRKELLSPVIFYYNHGDVCI